jgi:hypothetical protein
LLDRTCREFDEVMVGAVLTQTLELNTHSVLKKVPRSAECGGTTAVPATQEAEAGGLLESRSLKPA